MEQAYSQFHDFIRKNREKIELQLLDNTFDMKSLKGLINSGPLQLSKATDKKIHLGSMC